MVDHQTEIKLAHLIKTIGEEESQLEASRQSLAEKAAFEPYTVFKSIDVHTNDYLSVGQLQKFLEENNIEASTIDIGHLFKSLNSKGDSTLAYYDFLNFVIPKANATLRSICVGRDPYYTRKDFTLPTEIKYATGRVFEKAFNSMKKLEYLRKELAEVYQLNLLTAYGIVSQEKADSFDYASLLAFFQKHKIIVADEDITAFLRHSDKDKDGKLSYVEFVEAVSPLNIPVQPQQCQSPIRESTARLSPTRERNTLKSPSFERNSASRQKSVRESPLRELNRVSSPNHERSARESPLKGLSRLSPVKRESTTLKSPSFERNSPSRQRSARESPLRELNRVSSSNLERSARQSPLRENNVTSGLSTPLRSSTRLHEPSSSRYFGASYEKLDKYERLAVRLSVSASKSRRRSPSFKKAEASPTKASSPRKTASPAKIATPRKTESPVKTATPVHRESPAKVATPRKTASPAKVATPNKVESPSKLAESNLITSRTTFREVSFSPNRIASPARSPQIRHRARSSVKALEVATERKISSFASKTAEKPIFYSPRLSTITSSKSARKSGTIVKNRGTLDNLQTERSILFNDLLQSYLPPPFSPTKRKDAQELVSIFKKQIELNRELENQKSNLSLKSDFNLENAFKIFDVEGSGYVTKSQFQSGLEALTIFPNKQELYFLIKILDKDADGLIKLNDFEDMLTPKVERPYYSGAYKTSFEFTKANILEVFRPETLSVLKETLRMIMQTEVTFEYLRKQLSPNMVTPAAENFNLLDKNEDGYVTFLEFEDLFKEYGVSVTHKELRALFNRYDRDEDGKISYSDFIQEIIPKSPGFH